MSTPYLYLLMRNDLPSMNPGKLAAQAAHVANQFVQDLAKRCKQYPDEKYFFNLYKEWKEDRGFGTTITLGSGLFNINKLGAGDLDILSGIVYDPTYPMQIPYE